MKYYVVKQAEGSREWEYITHPCDNKAQAERILRAFQEDPEPGTIYKVVVQR